MNAAHAVAAARLAARLAAVLATPIATGSVVHVLPGYSLETRAQTNVDAWTDTTMYVVKVCANGDCLLDYDVDGEGEVYISQTRLERL